MDTAIWWWMALSLIAIFITSSAESRMQRLPSRWPLTAWRIACRLLWGGTAWFFLTVFSGMALHSFFPREPVYFLAGSWIVVAPALIWASIVVWVASGKWEASTDEAPVATIEGRIGSLFGVVATATGRTLKYVAWAIGAALVALAIYFLGSWFNSAIEDMPVNSAIILGAIIIACAVAARR